LTGVLERLFTGDATVALRQRVGEAGARCCECLETQRCEDARRTDIPGVGDDAGGFVQFTKTLAKIHKDLGSGALFSGLGVVRVSLGEERLLERSIEVEVGLRILDWTNVKLRGRADDELAFVAFSHGDG
jgi:hypothetical protein